MKKKYKMLCGETGRDDFGRYGRYLETKNKGQRDMDEKNQHAETENVNSVYLVTRDNRIITDAVERTGLYAMMLVYECGPRQLTAKLYDDHTVEFVQSYKYGIDTGGMHWFWTMFEAELYISRHEPEKESPMCDADKAIFKAACRLSNEIDTACSWWGFLNEEQAAASCAARKLVERYRRTYPEQTKKMRS